MTNEEKIELGRIICSFRMCEECPICRYCGYAARKAPIKFMVSEIQELIKSGDPFILQSIENCKKNKPDRYKILMKYCGCVKYG